MHRRVGRWAIGVCGAACCLATAGAAGAPAAAGGAAGAPGAAPRTVDIPLPRRVEDAPHPRTVHGHATLRLPYGWRRRGSSPQHDVRLTAPLPGGCRAEVEVQAGTTHTTKPIGEEVRQYVDFWFDTQGPAPVDAVASHTAAGRRWLLATSTETGPSPSEPSVHTYSPFFGVLVQRLAPHVWTSIALGPRVPGACPRTDALDLALEDDLLSMLRSARVAAHL